MLKKKGVRIQVAFLIALLFSLALTAFSVIMYNNFSRLQINTFDAFLYNLAVDMSGDFDIDANGRMYFSKSALSEDRKIFPFPLRRSYIKLRTLEGNEILRSVSLSADLDIPKSFISETKLFENNVEFKTIDTKSIGLKSKNIPLRLLNLIIKDPDWSDSFILQIAAPMDVVVKQQKELLWLFMLLIPCFVLVAVVSALYLSRRAMKPVNDIISIVSKINDLRTLSQRVPVPEAEDEIHKLALTFNDLLQRLEIAFSSHEKFIANASHQLKTPLAVLRGELDLLLQKYKTEPDLQQSLKSSSEEIDRLIKLVNNLLLLARVESGVEQISMDQVDFDDIVLRVVGRLKNVALEKNIVFKTQFKSSSPDLEFNGQVFGDEQLLFCVAENLVENAIKYSPMNSKIEIVLENYSSDLVFSVKDWGFGISTENHQNIFERFHRPQKRDVNYVPGTGLGLSIAKRIVEIHFGTIKVESSPEEKLGSKFIVVLPQSKK